MADHWWPPTMPRTMTAADWAQIAADWAQIAIEHEAARYCPAPWTLGGSDRIGVGTCRRSPWAMWPRDRCIRGLAFCCCDDPDCRRSLAVAMACAGST